MGLILRLIIFEKWMSIYKYYLTYLSYLRDEKSLEIWGLQRMMWDLYCDLLGLILRFIGTFLTVDNFSEGQIYWDLYCD